jgi:fatty acid desaturase
MKESLKQMFQAVVFMTLFMGFVLGGTLLASWIYDLTKDHWYAPLLYIGVMIVLFISVKLLPNIPSKDERLDQIEERLDEIDEYVRG